MEETFRTLSSKTYLIPLMKSHQDFPCCEEIGGGSLRNLCEEEICEKINKAVRNKYNSILFSGPSYNSPFWTPAVALCQKNQISCVFQVPMNVEGWQSTAKELLVAGAEVSIVVDHRSLDRFKSYLQIKIRGVVPFSFSVMVDKKLPVSRLLCDATLGFLNDLYFFFPHLESSRRFLTAEQICHWVCDFSDRSKGKIPQLWPGLDVYDPSIEEGRNLEPEIAPQYETAHSKANDPVVSVIVPALDNRQYLVKTIEHLQKQSVSPCDFEVIVIDDGSSDDTLLYVSNLIEQWNSIFSLKCVSYPRVSPRKMGDRQFRAGIARNLGFKNSKGPILLFLDSDILLPQDYIEMLIEQHKHFDVIQPKRIQINEDFSQSNKSYYDIEPGDTYRTESGYWEEFQDTVEDWAALNDGWKYVSTFCLSIKSRDFEGVGRFRKIFTSYGFEDTDLGLRLVKAGRRLKLMDKKVYHLYHEPKRSEYFRKEYRRHQALSRSAKIFYRQNLDPCVVNVLGVYLKNRKLWGLDYTAIFFFLKAKFGWVHDLEMYYWNNWHERIYSFRVKCRQKVLRRP